jgi:meso-butanediol dehydrogenase/(S,S)-butanediol dehydrogenase/diacetyl reductase
MQRFEDKAILITGAASGIGRAVAERLASEGGRVVCADLNESGSEEAAESIRKAGGQAQARACDVSDPAACQRLVGSTVEALGRLDVLCNVAGIGLNGHATDITPEQWNRVIAVNLSGTFFTCQAAIPHLLETQGAIVNAGSSAGLVGVAYTAAYAASKGAVVMLTRSLAVEYGRRGLRVNAVCPGGVNTPMVRGFVPPEEADIHLLHRMMLLGRLAEPPEIAGAFAYLASDEARYVNGATFSIDGGQVA